MKNSSNLVEQDNSGENISQSRELERQLRWFVNIRWLAVTGVIGAVIVSRFFLNINLPYLRLSTGILFMILYNLCFRFCPLRFKTQLPPIEWDNLLARIAAIQIFLDLTLLAYFIHHAGGVANPFILFFVFHMIIASILLSKISAYIFAGIASILLAVVLLGEYSGFLTHYHLTGFIDPSICLARSPYVFGVLGVFLVTLFLTVYMTTTVVEKLRRREHQLAVANQQLAEKDKLKSRYVMTVSHDLRSSLASVQSCLNVVLQGLTGGIDSDKSREMIARAKNRTTYMLKYVRDLLHLSIVRGGLDETEDGSVNLNELLEEVMDRFHDEARQSRVQMLYSYDSEIIVPGVREDWEQVFNNIVGNAIKYSSPGGQVVISVDNSKSKFHLKIKDEGMGIPTEELPKVFEDFYRATNARETDREGTGLGLAIVRQIVEKNGGEIKIQSVEGEGTTVNLIIPEAIDNE